MALRQMTKTKTQTQTVQVQSLETVQMLLHGSLSILSWCRELFPERAFEHKRFDLNGSITFEDYTAADSRAQLEGPGDAPFNTFVLQRGKSIRVDAFLGWLDYAYAALKKGELESLEVRIHPSLRDRQSVLETYHFSIDYLTDQHGRKSAVGLGVLTPSNGAITVEASQNSLRNALKEITQLAQTLPALPDSRFLTMRLNSWREESDVAPASGWVTSTADETVFPTSRGLGKLTSTMQLSAALHSGFARLTYVQPIKDGADGDHNLTGLVDNSAAQTSQSMLSVGKDLPLQADLEEEDTFVDDSFPQDRVNVAEPVQSRSPETLVPGADITPEAVSNTRKASHKPVQSLPQAVRRSSRTVSLRQQPELNSSQLTQASNIRPMRRFFEDAQEVEVISQGETQRQTTVGPKRAASISSETQSGIGDSPTKSGGNELLVGCTQPVLAKSKAIELQKGAVLVSKKGQGSLVVQCVCGCAHADQEMIRCTYCKTQQHPHCYGFISTRDMRIPAAHICYQCLLADSERGTLRQLERLSPKRRVMHYAFMHGIPRTSDLAKRLGLETSTIDRNITDLKKEGFLLNVAGSKQSGFAALGKPYCVAVRDGSDHNRMLRELFDPLTHISHHYDIPSKPVFSHADLSQQLLALQGSLMPPPTTSKNPARSNKRLASGRNSTSTRRGSSPHVPETPVRLSPRRSKRTYAAIDNEDDKLAHLSSPPKAKKRSKVSVDTQFVLNVNGEIPTSPAGPYQD